MKKADKARIERMLTLGCCACATLGIPNFHQIEVHHILRGNKRLGDWFTLPLCKGHHQGYFTETQKIRLHDDERVSIGTGRKPFNEKFGTERELWEKIQFVLDLSRDWPGSKVVSRRVPDEPFQPATLTERIQPLRRPVLGLKKVGS